MTQALAAFKNQYGDYPPSRIVCSENGKYDAATLGGVGSPLAKLAPRTLAAIRRFWPRVDLRTDGSAPLIPSPAFYDFNGNNQNDSITATWGKPYILSGAECLVFFLGGIPQSVGGSGWAVTGFAKSPTNPFQSATQTSNRTAPFHEFVSSRLINYPTEFNSGVGSPTGFPAFLDSLGAYNYTNNDPASDGAVPFYCYFSAYGGQGYDPSDVDMQEIDSASGSKLFGAFVSNNAPSATTAAGGVPGGIVSPAPNPYTNGPPVQTDGSGAPVTVAPFKPRVWQNANTYQIISAGRDRVFGIGGQYAAAANVKLPFVRASAGGYAPDTFQTVEANAVMTSLTLGNDVRARESDNLTSFSQGKLD